MNTHKSPHSKLKTFLNLLDQKVSERSTARNDYTKGYFLMDRPCHGFSEEHISSLCHKFNLVVPDPDVLELIKNNNLRYLDTRAIPTPPLYDVMRERGYIPSLAELGIVKPYNQP